MFDNRKTAQTRTNPSGLRACSWGGIKGNESKSGKKKNKKKEARKLRKTASRNGSSDARRPLLGVNYYRKDNGFGL